MSKNPDKTTPATANAGTEQNIAADVDEVMRKYDRESNTRIWSGWRAIVIKVFMACFAVYCICMTLFSTAMPEIRLPLFMLFQSGALFTDMNVFDNVAYPLREHTQLPAPLLHSTVMMKLEAVGLRGAAKLMPSELSGGMARRAALARAIALEPDLIMFDEPFVGQDPITMGVLVKLISELNSALGVTCVVVSHDVPEVLSIADHAWILADKKIV